MRTNLLVILITSRKCNQFPKNTPVPKIYKMHTFQICKKIGKKYVSLSPMEVKEVEWQPAF